MIENFLVPLAGLNLAAVMLLFLLNIRNMRKHLSGIRAHIFVILGLILCLQFALVSSLPTVFTSLYDEYAFADYAKEISCGDYELMQRLPLGYSVFMSMIFLVSGPSLEIMYIANALCFLLSTILIFLITFLIFGDERVSFLSSFIFSVFPLGMMLSRIAEERIFLLFFFLLTLYAFIIHFKSRDIRSFVLAMFTLSFLVNVRYEFIFMPAVFLIMFVLYDDPKRLMEKNRLIVVVVFLFIFCCQVSNAMGNILLYDGEEGPAFSADNITVNAGYLCFNMLPMFPLLSYVLMTVGIYSVFKHRRRFFIFSVFVSTALLLFYMSYDHFNWKHLPITSVFVIIFIANGVSFVLDIFNRKLPTSCNHVFIVSRIITYIAFFAVLAYFFLPISGMTHSAEYVWSGSEAYLQRDAVTYVERNIRDCTIAMAYPELLLSPHIKRLNLDEIVSDYDIQDECTLFFEDLFCQVPEFFYEDNKTIDTYRRLCREVHEEFHLTLYEEFSITLSEYYDFTEPMILDSNSHAFRLYSITGRVPGE